MQTRTEKERPCSLVTFYTTERPVSKPGKCPLAYGYEHVPLMLIGKGGKIFFGTKNGVVYSIDPATQQILWAHKIDNSMVNTVNVIDESRIIVSTMDGKVCLLQASAAHSPH